MPIGIILIVTRLSTKHLYVDIDFCSSYLMAVCKLGVTTKLYAVCSTDGRSLNTVQLVVCLKMD